MEEYRSLRQILKEEAEIIKREMLKKYRDFVWLVILTGMILIFAGIMINIF
ncbi:MAG: hypothetical protein UT43_C0017G0008 [Parcubacteria group bacterium GW2011_GWC1_39_29]|uniref:Uncharacterized protein n=1 Tax=Candidatus Yanofskybacteria bacterium GW2011_GWD1_39_16 TaxID=1619030 RepID=A0A837HUR4_9BACT|nr:MAG: hypothetical protein UT35_C0002G0007 [Candidatus Yanofskybacteria bacterium GW2011_GWD1_39_16]KKR14737.1 MAG: hypothetical protein UT43_C0017G0008 [Parcubacteria group bacterium GW2011_GWC1_39_29]